MGQLLLWLEQLGLLENTVVALVSDHGEAMEDDHGYYFCHGQGLTEDQVRVPLILHLPERPGGVQFPEGLPGRNLLEHLTKIPLPDSPFHTTAPSVPPVPGAGETTPHGVLSMISGQCALRYGPYKLIRRGGRTRLFNSNADPGETEDLADRERGTALWLEREMNTLLSRTTAFRAGASTEEWDSDVRDRLRALGYVE